MPLPALKLDVDHCIKNKKPLQIEEVNVELFTLSSDITLQELAPFQETLKVAGLHRACPSAALDKTI